MDENKSSWLVPVAIIICILLIGGAIYFKDKVGVNSNTASSTTSALVPDSVKQLVPIAEGANVSTFRAIDNTDKIRGSENAPVKIVVYTDLECPACKYFHQQLKAIEKNYVDTGKLAIVVRDFPLDSLHQKSRAEHLAINCVNDVGGNDKYWQFVDKIFEITPSNDGLDPAKLGETAKGLGIDIKKYDACVKDQKYATNIEKTVQEAVSLGAQGTPFFVIMTKDYVIPVFGGVPADRLSQVIDILSASATGEATTTSANVNSSTANQ